MIARINAVRTEVVSALCPSRNSWACSALVGCQAPWLVAAIGGLRGCSETFVSIESRTLVAYVTYTSLCVTYLFWIWCRCNKRISYLAQPVFARYCYVMSLLVFYLTDTYWFSMLCCARCEYVVFEVTDSSRYGDYGWTFSLSGLRLLMIQIYR